MLNMIAVSGFSPLLDTGFHNASRRAPPHVDPFIALRYRWYFVTAETCLVRDSTRSAPRVNKKYAIGQSGTTM